MPDLPAIAIAALAMANASPTTPIRLTASQAGGQTVFRVVAKSPVAVSAQYSLEISSGTGNRTRNTGTAQIRPGEVHELATVRVSGERYVAHLTVTTPEGSYERVLQSPEG